MDLAAGAVLSQDRPMATYRMVYGDSEQVVRETLDGVRVEREDGWTVFFRGDDAILRVRDEHIQELELVTDDNGGDAQP
jgi:hypothetical protein